MISLEFYKRSMEEMPFEIVERKGIGHPDTICDGVVERISLELTKRYKELFGRILHFNIDKALLSAGKVEKGFGWGRVIKPMEIFIGDRATFQVGRKALDVKQIVFEGAKSWIEENLSHINVERDIKINPVLSEGSEELTSIFAKKKESYSANDTSAAVGYYPMTETEKLVYRLERYLNSKEFKKQNPDTGEDVKIMALRKRKALELTIAMPFLAEAIKSEPHYFLRKAEVKSLIEDFVQKKGDFDKVKINLNALDRKGRGLNGVYLTLLGTSAEDADSGEVGRGNKVNGVIALARPIGTEACAGKNPISHVGKIYNVFSHYLAKRIFLKVEGLKEVYVFLLSEIGRPVERPKMIGVKLACQRNVPKDYVKREVRDVLAVELSNIKTFCEELSRGKYSVY